MKSALTNVFKNAAILAVIASPLGTSAVLAAPADTRELRVAISSDRPLVGPYSRAAGWPAVTYVGPAQMSELHYFNAPVGLQRCDFVRFKRVEGRLVRTCD